MWSNILADLEVPKRLDILQTKCDLIFEPTHITLNNIPSRKQKLDKPLIILLWFSGTIIDSGRDESTIPSNTNILD